MKHNLLFLAVPLMMAVSAHLSAAEITVFGIEYSTNGITPSVTGYTITGDIYIPESITYNGNTYSVTSIGYHAFKGSFGLTNITLPNNVTSIKEAVDKGSKFTSSPLR